MTIRNPMRELISVTNSLTTKIARDRLMVNGTVRSRRQLRSALVVAACRKASADAPGVQESKREQLDRTLAQTQPYAGSVFVHDKLLGFRPREKQHVSLVEVFGGEQAGTSVVKIGPIAALDKEIDGWKRCRTDGLRSDLVDVRRREGGAPPQRFH
jgi:hypothetical protein